MIRVKSFYGNVILDKVYCNYCKKYAILLDGLIQCCGREFNNKSEEEIEIRRESEVFYRRKNLTWGDKKKILKIQNYKCFYCSCDLRINSPVFDHLVNWAYSGNDSSSNKVASCADCNSLKSDKMLSSLQSLSLLRIIEKSKKRKKLK